MQNKTNERELRHRRNAIKSNQLKDRYKVNLNKKVLLQKLMIFPLFYSNHFHLYFIVSTNT